MKKIAAVLLVIAAVTLAAVSCCADVLMPAEGNKTKKSGSLTIDYSNCAEGYVMVKARPNGKKLRIRVTHEDMDIHYDLNSDGQYEVLPLQDGNGKYVFTLYSKVKGNQYKKMNTISLTVEMPDPDRCFLYPNQYINYTPDTPAVIRAQEVCEGLTDPLDKAQAIYEDVFVADKPYVYMSDTGEPDICWGYEVKFTYREIDIGNLPNIDRAFETKRGTCKEQAGLYTAMLRSVGVPAMYAVSETHAWVVFIIDGKRYEIDPILEVPFVLIPDNGGYTRIY